MNLSCRERQKPCCSSPPPTVLPLPEHCRLCLQPPTFSAAASWSFLCKGKKKGQQGFKCPLALKTWPGAAPSG
ncbi:hypothetical protein Nmel_017013 [Mimus melanotis]